MRPLTSRQSLNSRLKHAARLGLLCAGLSPLMLPATANAADTEVPDTIKWTIPFGVGGGTDVWARFFAPWFSESLAGEPTIMIDNVPGGGSINGANLFSVRARSDGSQWLGTSASTQYPAMLGDPRVRYDYADWKPILATPTGGVVYASPEMGQDADSALQTLLKQPVKLAAQSPTGVELPVLIALEMLGVDVDPVFGMRSRGEGRLAFERGEANIDFQTTSAYLSNVQPLVDDGKAIPLFSLGVLNDDGKIVRDPTFPDLPTFNEVHQQTKGEAPSGNAYEAYRKFFASGYALQKLVMVPVDTPEALTETYRQAARDFIKTDKFKEESAAQLGPYTPIIGNTVSAHLEDAMSIKDETRQWLITWLGDKFDVHLATR
ncbi:tricarboxylate transporter [Halomonas sp. McH1-25]|uniref:tricarboxylate transporter n=1 Tax=unclassified Halomonas TaxID=2609666 RepID=UPI001EF74C71|nr:MULTISPECIES: tricarboxylate transporter [unclassified Halomonas]MCG7598290.1 tricarboxylate transporter [Halomonas sp. McH1-25]MCP1340927.1 tricarboxylate transporter [Halomonas sp. FL8]MCP1362321.1 tricarboxylate transporter [Halomonas sp. BBD45]MCP1365767.1 tricarboxylate transporter [Halomonas sp. BBD48]